MHFTTVMGWILFVEGGYKQKCYHLTLNFNTNADTTVTVQWFSLHTENGRLANGACVLKKCCLVNSDYREFIDISWLILC